MEVITALGLLKEPFIWLWRKLSGQQNREKEAQKLRDQNLERIRRSVENSEDIEQKRRRDEIKPWFTRHGVTSPRKNNQIEFTLKNRTKNLAQNISVKKAHFETNIIRSDENMIVFSVAVKNDQENSLKGYFIEFEFEDEDGNKYRQRFEREDYIVSEPVPINE